jgi:post-segregation antitoxin (ccd killing protein)
MRTPPHDPRKRPAAMTEREREKLRGSMSSPRPAGRKRTVSLTLSESLVEQARAEKVNISAVAEEALARLLVERQRERLREEIARDIQACDAYVAEYGSFAEMARAHYEQEPD